MRELFVSEQRYLRNILLRQANVVVERFDPVVDEYHAPLSEPRVRRFNRDYCLRFVANPAEHPIRSYCTTILPNTIGGDLFVTVDKGSNRILMTELLGGAAFQFEHFGAHIGTIEQALDRLRVPVGLCDAAYCRVFVIESDICFLVFPEDSEPGPRGEKTVVHTDAASRIECATEAGRLVYVDGWLRTEVRRSDWKLEARHE